jgi:hypothetical protein
VVVSGCVVLVLWVSVVGDWCAMGVLYAYEVVLVSVWCLEC